MKNVHGWIILFLLLIPTCFFSAIGINKFLIFMSETPLYTNMFRYEDVDMSIKLPEGWAFEADEDNFYLSNKGTSETLYLTEVESANSMETAKSMFLISLENSYKNIEYKEGTLSSGKTEIYYVTYSEYTKYYISGVVSNNDMYFNFIYQTPISNPQMSPLGTMLKSIKFNQAKQLPEQVATQ